MKFSRQFVGGSLLGLAFGLLVGAAVAERQKKVNYTSIAGVGVLLAISGVAAARTGGEKGT